MKTKPSAAAPPRLPEFAEELGQRMARVRRWRSVVVFATAGAWALAVILAALVAEGLVDFVFVLPWWVRVVWLLAVLGGTGWLVWKFGMCVRRQEPDDETVALMIERGLPEFHSRFISAVQLARGKPTPLVRALVAETVALARTKRLSAAIDKRGLWRALGVVAIVAFTGVALWLVGAGKSAPLARRAVWSREPAPRLTKLNVLTGNRTIGPGDDFTVEAGVSGLVPGVGRVHVKSATGRALDLPLEAEAGHPTHFLRVLPGVPEPFDYYVVLGDAHSETFHVKLRPRPAITEVGITEKFPAYTKLPTRSRTPGDLKLLAGSRLAFRVKADAPIKAGVIRFAAGAQTISEAPLTPEANDATRLSGEIAVPSKGATGLALRLVDAEGLESRGTTVYRVEIVGDGSPTVKVRRPERPIELVTPDATMRLAFEAKDDFGLAKVRLHYAVDWTEGAKAPAVDLDLGGGLPMEVARALDWNMGKIQPPVSEGQVIDYWLEALDTKEPAGVGTMEHYQVRLVSELEKRADLANRLADGMKRLGELRQGVEDANAKLGGLPEPAGGASAAELLNGSETRQRQLAGETQKLAGHFAAALDEYERNRLGGVDAEAVKKIHGALTRLASGEMQAAVESLQKARAGDAGKALAEAGAAQKQALAQMAQLLAEHGRQQSGLELSHALGQLAERQAANLQKAIESGKRVVVKKTESLGAAIIQGDLDAQTAEQAALATELKSVAEQIARFAKEPGHAEMAQRFQQAATEAQQRVQPIVDGAAAMLKAGQVFKAGSEEKAARDALRRIAKWIAPPQNPGEALRAAERELGKMMTEETVIATEVPQGGTPEEVAALESRQGRLVARSDLLAQDLAVQTPNAAQAVRAALEKMQEVRAMMLDKALADAAQNAQTALTHLEKARTEIAALAARAALPPPQQRAAPNASPAAPQVANVEREAGELAKIIEGVQRLKLETAKIVAQALPNNGEQFRGLDVRQADLRAQIGDVKTALAGEPAEAVDALTDAGRDMGAAKSQLEASDGPGADATQRKVLGDLYRAQRALSRRIAQAAEQPGGNEAVLANAMSQTAAQIVQAQTAFAEAQRGLQKVEAAGQAGGANTKALRETAVVLAQAAQQAGRAAAGVRLSGEAARRALQEAAQDSNDATAQAIAGRAAAAQEKANAAQAKLAQAAIALAQEQAGLASADDSAGGSGPRDERALDFSGLPARDRAVLEQAQGGKYPAEYGAQVGQYLRNLAGESAGK